MLAVDYFSIVRMEKSSGNISLTMWGLETNVEIE